MYYPSKLLLYFSMAIGKYINCPLNNNNKNKIYIKKCFKTKHLGIYRPLHDK